MRALRLESFWEPLGGERTTTKSPKRWETPTTSTPENPTTLLESSSGPTPQQQTEKSLAWNNTAGTGCCDDMTTKTVDFGSGTTSHTYTFVYEGSKLGVSLTDGWTRVQKIVPGCPARIEPLQPCTHPSIVFLIVAGGLLAGPLPRDCCVKRSLPRRAPLRAAVCRRPRLQPRHQAAVAAPCPAPGARPPVALSLRKRRPRTRAAGCRTRALCALQRPLPSSGSAPPAFGCGCCRRRRPRLEPAA